MPEKKRKSLLAALAERRLLMDGSMGVYLQSLGLPPGTAPELWNVTAPDEVAAAHQAYLDAGAELIQTNTFGGSPAKLGLHGLADRTEEINRAAAEIARGVAGDRAWVVGSVGPSGKLLAPFGDLPPAEAADGFKRQVEILAAAGVDALNIETMSDLVELRLAIMAALATGLPVMAEVAFDQHGRTLYGSAPDVVGAFMSGFPLTAAGTNCGLPPEAILPLLPGFQAFWRGPLIVQANAGSPARYQGPAEYAAAAAALARAGAAIIGGCCGTTPEHIAALGRELSAVPEYRPAPSGGGQFITSRLTAARLVSKPDRAVPVRRGLDMAGAVQAAAAHEHAPVLFDLRGTDVPTTEIAHVLQDVWMTIDNPIIFNVDREEILAAAVALYPGRPGVIGPRELKTEAERFGGLWLDW